MWGSGSALPPAVAVQFRSGMFGPGVPVTPFDLGDPTRNGIEEPRLTEYLPGWNYPIIPGQGKLLSFAVLRALADLVLPARKAIEIRKQEVAVQPWDIVLRPEYHDQANNKELQEVREDLIDFFHYPDRYEELTFSQWIMMAEEEIDVIDALSVYLRPTISPIGGVLGSGLGALNIIDGSLVKPLRDYRGGRPQPPAPAYQVFTYGAPRANMYMLGVEEEDDAGPSNLFTANELIYRPFNRRTFAAYGFSNLEMAVNEIKLWIDRERYHQSYFDASDLPAMFVTVPKEWPQQQINEYEQTFNRRLAGDPQWRWRVKMIPSGGQTGTGNVIPVKQPQYDLAFDEHLIRLIAMAFDVTAEEMGVQPKGGLGGRGWAEESGRRIIRLALQPRLQYFAELFNFIIKRRLRVNEFVFQWIDTEQTDARDKAFADQTYVASGIRTRAEVREENGWDILDSPGINELLVTTPAGTMPLSQVAVYGRVVDATSGQQVDTTTTGQTGDVQSGTPTPTPAGETALHQARPDTPVGGPTPGSDTAKAAMARELDQWERVLKNRGKLARPFHAPSLPVEFKEKMDFLTNYMPDGTDHRRWQKEIFSNARKAVEDMGDDDSLVEWPVYARSMESLGLITFADGSGGSKVAGSASASER